MISQFVAQHFNVKIVTKFELEGDLMFNFKNNLFVFSPTGGDERGAVECQEQKAT